MITQYLSTVSIPTRVGVLLNQKIYKVPNIYTPTYIKPRKISNIYILFSSSITQGITTIAENIMYTLKFQT